MHTWSVFAETVTYNMAVIPAGLHESNISTLPLCLHYMPVTEHIHTDRHDHEHMELDYLIIKVNWHQYMCTNDCSIRVYSCSTCSGSKCTYH